MKSISKTPVNIEQARAIAQKHLSQPLRKFSELADGYFNAAYRLDLADGATRVLKVAPLSHVQTLRYERDIMQAEVGALQQVRQQTEMPVPQVYVHDTSRALLPADYFVMDFIPGISFWNLRKDLSESDQQAIEREAGRYLRR